MIRCPKCRSDGENIILREMWRDHCIEFDQRKDGTIEPEGILLEGSACRVDGKCGVCGHGWKLRGILQITDIKGYGCL